MRKFATCRLLFLTTLAAISVNVPGQEPAAGRPSFEVASIKPNNSAREIPGPWAETEDYFAWNGRTLKTLISTAYGVRSWQIEGGPGWINTSLWDLEAKAEHQAAVDTSKTFDKHAQHLRLMSMLQSLLEDRFKLKLERRTRQSPVYNLVVSKDGPKIKLDDDQSPPGRAISGPPQSSASGWELQRGTINARTWPNEETIEGRAVTLATFIIMLVPNSDRPVIDRTNLKGLYNLKVSWPREETAFGGATGGSSPLVTTKLHFDPAFFTALQEQLGLKLESGKGPVEFLIITSAQKPSGN